MQYSEKLLSAVQRQDVISARVAILSYLDGDETCSIPLAYRIAMEVAEKFTAHDDPFFDPEDHVLNVPPQKDWTVSLLIKIKASLRTNFSREKLELAENVIAHLRAQGDPDFQVKSNEANSRPVESNIKTAEKKTTDQYHTGPRTAPSNAPNKFLAGAITGGIVLGGVGLVVGLIAGCALKAAVTGMVAGAIVGGILNQRKHQ